MTERSDFFKRPQGVKVSEIKSEFVRQNLNLLHQEEVVVYQGELPFNGKPEEIIVWNHPFKGKFVS